MFALSPFSPVQIYEQVQPATRVGRTVDCPFTAPEQDAAASRKKDQAERAATTQDQALRGFGASATLLSSALLTELGRQMALPPQMGAAAAEKETGGAVADKKRKSADSDPEAAAESLSEDAESVEGSVNPQVGPPPSSVNLSSDQGQSQGDGRANTSSMAGNEAGSAEPDRSVFLLRLQRAKSVYAQGQMASGDYAFVRSAEVFQMVA